MQIQPQAIYQIQGEAIIQLIDAATKAALDYCKREINHKHEWLTQEEAMKYLKVASKQKMQAIRDTGKVAFKKLGGEYRYNSASLEKFMNS